MQSFRDEMLQFVDAVNNGTPIPATVEAAIALVSSPPKSVAEGRPVKISEIK